MVSTHQALPFFSKVISFLLNRRFVFRHLMKMVQWLEISGTYQDLSKGNHHLQIVPTQTGREESQKRNVKGIFTGKSGTKLAPCVLSGTKKMT